MERADRWVASRIAHTEIFGTILTKAIDREHAAADFRRVWQSVEVIELSPELAQAAGGLMATTGLKALDAIHLASAEEFPARDRVLATFDRRLWDVARERGHDLLPEKRP